MHIRYVAYVRLLQKAAEFFGDALQRAKVNRVDVDVVGHRNLLGITCSRSPAVPGGLPTG